MNHVVNRRMSKRQQMRWSLKGAHCLLQTRVELLDGRLEANFAKHFPHFRSPECVGRDDSPSFAPLPSFSFFVRKCSTALWICA